jgi:hypothetical protein
VKFIHSGHPTRIGTFEIVRRRYKLHQGEDRKTGNTCANNHRKPVSETISASIESHHANHTLIVGGIRVGIKAH